MRRITISLADSQAEAIERIRRRRRVPRSRIVQQAIALYLSERGHYEAVRTYEEGYRRRPEGSEARAYAKASAATMAREDWR